MAFVELLPIFVVALTVVYSCCYLMGGIMRDKQVKPLLAQHLDPIVECLGPVLSLERLVDEVRCHADAKL
jgi:hypothetical protein